LSAVKCLDCGTDYAATMALDLALPRAQWLLIHPSDGGVLCANCMLGRAARLPGVINVTGLITFAADSWEVYWALSAMAARSNSP
jgi:hypothetical protein